MNIDLNPPKKNFYLSIQNFRVFKEKQIFNFAPLTLLIGPNSSGKSSIIKFLSVLNFSANKYNELSTYAPLKLDGNYLPNEFIDLSNSISDFSFPIKFELQDSRSVFFKDFSYEFEFFSCRNKSALDLGKFVVKVKEIEIIKFSKVNFVDTNDNKFVISINLGVLLEELKSFASRMESDPMYSVLHYSANKVFDTLKYNDDLFIWKNKIGEALFTNKLRDFQEEYLKKTFTINIENLPEYLITNSNPSLRDNGLSGYIQGVFSYLQNEFVNELNKQKIFDDIELSEIGNYISKEYMQNIGLSIYRTIFEQTKLTKSSVYRTKRNRYFVLNENLNSSFEIALNKYIMTSIFLIEGNTIYGCDYVDIWLNKFKIGESLQIIAIDKSNTIFTIEILMKDGKRINIADLGYGSGQILSLILVPFLHLEFDIVSVSLELGENNNLISKDLKNPETKSNVINWNENGLINLHYLEEPETNLHPNWQSLMAELFSFHLTLGIKYIIETHSEYLVRNIQKLVAKKLISHNDVSIHYFNSDDNVDESQGEPKVKNIQIIESGGLTDNFGPGFFDEAHNLKFELLKINKQQLN
jgi:energy-coupling factor transporter ATP-binding protein EcfA2